MKNRKFFLAAGLMVIILTGMAVPAARAAEEKLARQSRYDNPVKVVTIGKARVAAEVVSSPKKLYLGLGKRPSLPEGQGMLFIMPSWEIQNFCMRDMRFPIDFIWIGLGRVRGMTKNVSAKDQQACYLSPEPVNYVLEVPAGFCDRHGIKVGDKVSW